LGAVSYGQDIDAFESDFIDEAVIALKDLPDRLILVLRYDPASAGLLRNTVATLNQLIDEALRIVRLIPGYVLTYLPKAEY
jgi:hypothetical protein